MIDVVPLEVKLDNGFRALLLERHNLPVVASTLWYRVGSRDERTGETGLSHFLEHMMFKGTSRYAKGEIDLLTSKLGGSNNAFTTHDVTAYYFALASDRWETALEIEANRMTDCLLDDGEFEAEKSVVLEEMAMGEDDPWGCLYRATETLCYQVHPYHHPIIGWREDVANVTSDAMRAYYGRSYGPERAFLVAVGDFDADRAGDRVRELFGGIAKNAEPRSSVLSEPAPRGERRLVETFPGQGDVARMTISVLTCRMGEQDDFALDVLAHLLGGSKSSRLYRRLVLDESIATNLWVTNEVRLDPGLLCISIELREGVDPRRAEVLVHEELDALLREGIKAAELRRIRTQLRASFLFEEETVLEVALRLGRFEATAVDGYRLLAEVFDRYEAVRSTDVKAIVKRYLDPERWSIVWLLPDGRRNGGWGRPAARRRRGGAGPA